MLVTTILSADGTTFKAVGHAMTTVDGLGCRAQVAIQLERWYTNLRFGLAAWPEPVRHTPPLAISPHGHFPNALEREESPRRLGNAGHQVRATLMMVTSILFEDGMTFKAVGHATTTVDGLECRVQEAMRLESWRTDRRCGLAA